MMPMIKKSARRPLWVGVFLLAMLLGGCEPGPPGPAGPPGPPGPPGPAGSGCPCWSSGSLRLHIENHVLDDLTPNGCQRGAHDSDGTRFAFIYRTGNLTGAATTEVPGEVGNCALSLDGSDLVRHDNLTLETVASCRSDVITLGLSIANCF